MGLATGIGGDDIENDKSCTPVKWPFQKKLKKAHPGRLSEWIEYTTESGDMPVPNNPN